MTISVDGTNGLVFPDSSTQNTGASGFGFKNRIINGAMMIDQRNTGASVTPTNGQYLVDRWFALAGAASKFSAQQSSVAPAGFANSILLTSLSAYSVAATDNFGLRQNIEGFNTADFNFGTANASALSLSFWVYSSLTGTFGGSVQNAAGNRSYVFSYSIPSANTWTKITVPITGDTGGTWVGASNAASFTVNIPIGNGSTYSTSSTNTWLAGNYQNVTGAISVVGTNGATFYITGVQLEKGSTATSFDYRPYGTELQLCQRYYLMVDQDTMLAGKQNGTTQVYATVPAPVPLRATPSASFVGGVTIRLATQSGYKDSTSTTVSVGSISTNKVYNMVVFNGFSGLSDWYVGNAQISGTLQLNAEL